MKITQPIHILVLMAGDGKRFTDAGYKTPKPLIPIHGKTILEWTTRSLPFIKHYGKSLIELPYKLTFATRKKHNVNEALKKIYGDDININELDYLTKGNLQTAFISCLRYYEPDMPLLVLDADNMYDSTNLFPTIENVKEKDHAVICYFEPYDNSEKWCFAQINKDTGKVLQFSEKKKIDGGFPMMGVFWFSSQRLFMNLAQEIIHSEEMTNNEFFMSQAVQLMVEKEIPVYGFEAPKVWPLGTPEDLELFAYENY